MVFCNVFCIVPPAVENEADDVDDNIENDEQSVAVDDHGMSCSHWSHVMLVKFLLEYFALLLVLFLGKWNRALVVVVMFMWEDAGLGSITPHTVVWQCCKDDQQSQWEMPNFGVCQLRNPWVDFQKFCRVDYVGVKCWGQSVQRCCVCACVKFSPSGVYFFSFFGSMRLATGRPVGTIAVVNGSNDAPSWRSRPFYGSINNKIIFQYFYPKMWKIALRPMESLKSYNFGIVEDTYKMFAPNRGFSGSANLMVSFKLTPNQPLLPWQPIVVIKHISYNSACIKDTSLIIEPTRGFRGRRI